MENKKRVLVVGAGGFVGGFAVEEGLRRGYEVWAGVRNTTSRRYLTDERINFIEFDFDDADQVRDALATALPGGERWDWIIYNLGATKAVNFTDFNRVNYEFLRTFTTALKATDMEPEKFLYMSSLSVMGPGDEKGTQPFTEKMVPAPNTRYGTSKLKAEMWLEETTLPYIIFRATGVYGPREKDYFLMLKSIKAGFDFSVGFKRQLLTFIYVDDLVGAMYDALERSAPRRRYIISEERYYTQGEFRRLALRALGRKFAMPVKVPLWGLKAVCAVAEKWGVARMKASTLNRDKYRIMRQRNWNADIRAAREGFGFTPRVDLEEGLRRSVEWYRKEGWL